MPTADLEPAAPVAITAEEIESQLAKMLDSHHFRHSHRYPALLRYLVEQSQSGKVVQLKERLLGIEVFHRAPDYDTNTDPVVRVTAAEVRKRIAQYYQEPEHAGELRIDLPIGSYTPRIARSPYFGFKPVAESDEADNQGAPAPEAGLPEEVLAPMAGEETISSPAQMRWRRWSIVAAAVCAGALLAVLALESLTLVSAWRERALHSFWAPLASADTPVLLILGDHTVGTHGNALRAAQDAAVSPSEAVLQLMNEHEQVTLTDVLSLFKLTDYMVQHDRSYRVAGPAHVDVADMRNGPVILYAGLNNRWAMRLSEHLRYRFVDSPDDTIGTIADAQMPGRNWQVNFNMPYSKLPMDYAIVARYVDPLIEQPVMMVAGIGANGTTSAGEFVTSERMIEDMDKLAPKGWKHGNVEVVLAVPVIDGHPGAPHIVASQFW